MKTVLDALKRHNQDALLAYLGRVGNVPCEKILSQLWDIDLDEFFEIVRDLDGKPPVRNLAPRAHPVLQRADLNPEALRGTGETPIRRGELGFLVVAGGQGSRLGFEHPKGMFPIGVISQRCLFQIHFEKIAGFGRFFGFTPHVFVMTSSTNDRETRAFLEKHAFFGLPASCVHLFQQGNLPALDDANQIILSELDSVFVAPDGHGGALKALRVNGMLEFMERQGIKYISYFQVDNPLVNVCDPLFLGAHIEKGSQVSTKVIRKRDALEKLGVPVLLDGKPHVIEYSDLPLNLAEKKTGSGELEFAYGSIGIHLFDVAFINSLTSKTLRLPYHKARKAIPFFDLETSQKVLPRAPNGKKIEQFVFDAIPMASNALFFETERLDEFAPLKNRDGEDSIATCRQGQSEYFRRWFKAAGYNTETVSEIEVAPTFAACEEEFAAKIRNLLLALPQRMYIG